MRLTPPSRAMLEAFATEPRTLGALDEFFRKVASLVALPGDVVYSTTATRAGALAADGSAVSRTLHADLFAAIGTTYGPGDGSTTFNLPTVPASGDATAFIVF